MQAKQVAFFLFKANPSHDTLCVYKAESRRISKFIRVSRRQYESKLADEVKSNPRRFFAHVRRNRRLKQRIMALRGEDGPRGWRKAIICPIFKKGDPVDAANYRPVN